MTGRSITMLGTGLIGDFYTATLHAQRSRDRVGVVYSRTAERGEAFEGENGVGGSEGGFEGLEQSGLSVTLMGDHESGVAMLDIVEERAEFLVAADEAFRGHDRLLSGL